MPSVWFPRQALQKVVLSWDVKDGEGKKVPDSNQFETLTVNRLRRWALSKETVQQICVQQDDNR